MVISTEIAKGMHRISFYDEADLAKLTFPGASYNLFLIAADQPAIINTMLRRTFKRLRDRVSEILAPASLRYIIVPHHEGDSSGAINEWLAVAPKAVPVCSELCAVLSLYDFADREPMVVKDGQLLDLGSHRLRFLMTPHINQWESLMVYEETTRTLFPQDLFSTFGVEVSTDSDTSARALQDARQIGYQPDDRVNLNSTLDKIEDLELKTIAPMHGPVRTGHLNKLIRCFRENSLAPVSP